MSSYNPNATARCPNPNCQSRSKGWFVPGAGLAIHLRRNIQCNAYQKELAERRNVGSESGLSAEAGDSNMIPMDAGDAEAPPMESMTGANEESAEMDMRQVNDQQQHEQQEAHAAEENPNEYLVLSNPEHGRRYGEVPEPSRWHREREAQHPPLNFAYPFRDLAEAELARWFLTWNISKTAIDEFLKLEHIRRNPPAWRNAQAMFDLLSREAPFKPPEWEFITFSLAEAPNEKHNFWYRDLHKVADWIFSNPKFEEQMDYAPKQIYTRDGKTRIYHEMSTGDDWKTAQGAADVPKEATIQAGMLATDAAAMTSHAGGVVSHNVLWSMGNISNDVRASLDSRAWKLVAYIPKCNWSKTNFGSTRERELMTGVLNRRLFHACCRILVAPLKNRKPRLVQDADGWKRLVITVLIAWLCDMEEQWHILGLVMYRCPFCLASYHDLDKPELCPKRTGPSILAIIESVKATLPDGYTAYQFVKAASKEGLCGIEYPFWADLLDVGSDICQILSVDILHSGYKFWMDHPMKWNTHVVGKIELDRRLMQQPHWAGFRSFPTGISKISQWTCRQTRDLQKMVLPTLAGAPLKHPSTRNRWYRANRAALDYINISALPCHTDKSLERLRSSVETFREEVAVFIENDGRRSEESSDTINHFRIPKIHVSLHFDEQVRAKGSLVGQSTETLEAFHPLVSKDGYHLTNHRDHEVQLLRWLNRREAMEEMWNYFEWWMGDIGQVAEEDGENNADQAAADNSAESADDEAPLPHSPAQRITKTPHRKNITLQTLATEHGIPSLLSDLSSYLRALDPSLSSWPEEFTGGMDVWYSLRVEIPVVNDFFREEWRRLRATPAKSSNDFPHYDPVLIHETDEAGVTGFEGTSIGELCLIFRPSCIRRFPKTAFRFPQYLAYVGSFTSPVPASYDSNLGLYSVHKRYTIDGRRIGRVIELSQVIRPCPLSPILNSDTPIEGEANTPSSDIHSSAFIHQRFYINPFLTHSDFVAFGGPLY